MDEVGLFNVVSRVVVGMLVVFDLSVSLEAVTMDRAHYWALNAVGVVVICCIFIILRTVFRRRQKKRRRQ